MSNRALRSVSASLSQSSPLSSPQLPLKRSSLCLSASSTSTSSAAWAPAVEEGSLDCTAPATSSGAEEKRWRGLECRSTAGDCRGLEVADSGCPVCVACGSASWPCGSAEKSGTLPTGAPERLCRRWRISMGAADADAVPAKVVLLRIANGEGASACRLDDDAEAASRLP